ncbi:MULTISPECIES: chorismate mutase [Rhodococcus]|uniref:chorismate mutase n=1 Tax=Rhodococcus TaxID=1827 RepID=UPI000EA8C607|nr:MULTISPECIES: chorismate mutase [Rhodococcus]MBA8961018.1 chorismate mutase [Rhodococcus opacus]MBP2203116.1 chorismate mutase [Rhodococcus opacus]MDI9937509.1 chorismate mutase [Rhodococcus sp. IEGM 1351]QZS53079.1 chorismate mutase [Rhodococcus opacus]RKM73837.1 chorismate mutase AroQ, gamma subclass [Rhodococcus opacus]
MTTVRPALAARAAVAAVMLGLLTAGGTAPAGAQTRPLEPIARAVSLRLATADAVAAAKWGTPSPIDDPAREAQVLNAVATQAADEGLSAARVQQVFRDQIEANKEVQRALFAWWSVAPGAAPTVRPDLTQVRPVIDRRNSDILLQLREQEAVLAGPGCVPALVDATVAVAAEQRLDPLHQATLARALVSICGPVRE